MAELSRSETDLLIDGAKAIAQLREFGVSQEELQGILQTGAQRFGNTVSRGNKGGSFRFSPPFTDQQANLQGGSTFEEGKVTYNDPRYSIERPNSNLRPIAERTGVQTPRPAGTPRDRPEITAQYIGAVIEKLKNTDVGLKEALEAKGLKSETKDYGQRILEGNLSVLGSDEDRMMQQGGLTSTNDLDPRLDRQFSGAPSQTVDVDTADPVTGKSRKRTILLTNEAVQKADKEAAYQELVAAERRGTRFANPATMEFGDAPEDKLGTTDITGSGTQEPTRRTYTAGAGDGTVKERKGYFRGLKPSSTASSTSAAMAAEDALNQLQSAIASGKVQETPEVQQLTQRLSEDSRILRERRIQAEQTSVKDTSLVNDKGQPDYVTMDTAVAGSNTPDTNNNLNAPTPQSATEFVAQQVNATGSADIFADKQVNRNVDIGGSLGALDQAIAGLAGREMKVQQGPLKRTVTPFSQEMISGLGPIRSVDALQKAADAILSVGQAAGVNFPQMVMTEGRMKAEQVAAPGVSQVLQFLNMNRGQNQNIGLALDQIQQSTQSRREAEALQRYVDKDQALPDGQRINFGVRDLPGVSSGMQPEADVARETGDKVQRKKAAIMEGMANQGITMFDPGAGGRNEEGRPLGAEVTITRPSQDALMPFIGLEEGMSDRGTMRKFNPASIPEGMTAEQGIRAQAAERGQTGPAVDMNVEKALRVQRNAARAEEDAAVRRVMQEAAIGGRMLDEGYRDRKGASYLEDRPDPVQAELALRRRGSRRMY